MARPKPLGPYERGERDRLAQTAEMEEPAVPAHPASAADSSDGRGNAEGASRFNSAVTAESGDNPTGGSASPAAGREPEFGDADGPPGTLPTGPAGGTTQRRQLKPTDQKRLNRAWRRAIRGRLAVICDGVGTPYNVGQIVRSAATFGVERLWLAANSATPAHPGSRKTSLGTERNLRWDEAETAADAISAARADGFRVIAVELASGAVPLHEAPLDGDVCLVVGAEDHGCSPATLAAVDAVTYIPQPGKVGSLNVAVACAVAMAEVRRRHWMATEPPPNSH